MTLIDRRGFILGSGATLLSAATGNAAAAFPDAEAIVRRFASVKTMSGSFVQFDPKGGQTEGTFALQRPGRIRFDYAPPSPMTVIADGRSVAVSNSKLKTWNLYPLARTPLKLLLDDQIDLENDMVKQVEEKPGHVAVLLADKNLFGSATIKVMFDRKSHDLKQWTVTDETGSETAVVIYDVIMGAAIPPRVFNIPYSQIRTLK